MDDCRSRFSEKPRMQKSMWHVSWKKIAFFFTFVTGVFVLYWDFASYETYEEPREGLSCYDTQTSKILELNEEEPVLGSGIYFHESSCPMDTSDLNLNARQSCSIESALKAHPELDVFLLISSPVRQNIEKTKNIFVKKLLEYKNFKPRHIVFSKYLSNTPMYTIYTSGVLNSSKWPIEHASDVLRYTTLYKFGGIYLDLDVIVLKSLVKLKNFAGLESDTSIGSGILGFSTDKVGREMAIDCADELSKTYNPSLWGFNGPGVISRVLKKRCTTTVISSMPKSFCREFQVHPTTSFSPIFYGDAALFFSEGNTEKVKKITSKSYTIHFWNKISYNFAMDNNQDIPFLKFAEEYCPKIFKVSKGNFNI